MCGKFTLETKVREPKLKTEGAPKFVKSTKHEPSTWEHVDEMNTIVGSLGTPSVVHKAGCDNKKKKWIIIWMNFVMNCNNTF